jgi:hypothetical protein
MRVMSSLARVFLVKSTLEVVSVTCRRSAVPLSNTRFIGVGNRGSTPLPR